MTIRTYSGHSNASADSPITNGAGDATFFYDSSSGGTASITNNAFGATYFEDSSTAGSANITNNSGGGTAFFNSGAAGNANIINNIGGTTYYYGTSSGGNATITNNAGGGAGFYDTSSAGNATITNLGGLVAFYGNSTAGNATLNNTNGLVDFSRSSGPNGDGRISAGSIAGRDTYALGGNRLTVGGNNATTTVSGSIEDGGLGGGTGASLDKAGTGTLTLTGSNIYTGGTAIGAGTLELGNPSSAGTGAIAFGTGSGRLSLQSGAQRIGGTFGNRLDDFSGSNSLDLRGFAFNGTTAYTATGSTITVTGGAGGSQTQTFALRNGAASYVASSDGSGGTLIRAAAPAPCFVTGTAIRVLRGRTVLDVPVERLGVGDLALTAAGRPRPIRWIGSRSHPGLTAPRADRPVRIRAGALRDGVPARDLLVSPDHALWLDGLLVAAGHLVNGASITRGEAVAGLAYWHVELDSHDLLLAENTPAESFLAAPGVRERFDGGSDRGLDGGTAGAADEAPMPYAARVEPGPALDALRRRLILRAGLSVDEGPRFGALRAWLDLCDGRRVAGWAQDLSCPDGPVCLDIVVDGTVVAVTLAEAYRADVAAAGVGDGRHGFDLDLDEPLAPGVAHTVELRRSGDGARVCAAGVDAAGVWTPLLAA